MNLEQALAELEAAYEANDHIRGLKAQRTVAIKLLKDPESLTPQLAKVFDIISKTSGELTKIEGLQEEFSPEEKENLEMEASLRKIIGKGSILNG